MARSHVSHSEIAQFADEKVNLKRDDAIDLRRQANMNPTWLITRTLNCARCFCPGASPKGRL